MTIPATPEDLTPAWFSEVLDAPVTEVQILDAHSGTTGRARVGLTGSAGVPATLFVKLQPFTPEQRGFLQQVGMGVAEARLYQEVGDALPVRIPRVWHAAHDASDGSFVMVLEDLTASGCRFLSPEDDDISDVATSMVDELAKLHAAYQGAELGWLVTPDGMRSKPKSEKTAKRRPRFIELALDQFGTEMGPAFRRVAELYIEHVADVVALFNEGERTLIHGDTHAGNLFLDGSRIGFYDWAVAGRGPGVRDVAYFLCNSLPSRVRRSDEDALLKRYRSALESAGVTLDEQTARDQYRLFSIYSWVAAASTAAMGSAWQAVDYAHAALVRTTQAVDDLDVVGLLEERLGI